MSWRNRLIRRNGRIGLLCPGHPDFAVHSARGGECSTSTAVDHSTTQGEGRGQADERRSLVLCPALPMVPAGFRCYWSWKSRRHGGRPQVQAELRSLVRQMSLENPLWGAPRILGCPIASPWASADRSRGHHHERRIASAQSASAKY
jgi:hypothetical protein